MHCSAVHYTLLGAPSEACCIQKQLTSMTMLVATSMTDHMCISPADQHFGPQVTPLSRDIGALAYLAQTVDVGCLSSVVAVVREVLFGIMLLTGRIRSSSSQLKEMDAVGLGRCQVILTCPCHPLRQSPIPRTSQTTKPGSPPVGSLCCLSLSWRASSPVVAAYSHLQLGLWCLYNRGYCFKVHFQGPFKACYVLVIYDCSRDKCA